jgi:subtilase family serine protease
VRSSTRRPLRLAALASFVLLVSVVGAVGTGPSSVAAGAFAPLPAPEGCVDGTKPDPQKGLEPNQIAVAYGIAPLWEAGYRGQGVRMALIEPGQTYDADKYAAFVGCWGAPVHAPTQLVVGPAGPIAVGSEATFDVQVAVGMAPALDGLYVVSSASGEKSGWASLIEAALDEDRTGGTLVDVVSLSFGLCESEWDATEADRADRAAMEAALHHAADLGVKVLVAGGDSGSTACAVHPVVPGSPGTGELAVGYPGSSEWVTAVGGTQFDLDGTIETGGSITLQRVWHQSTEDDSAFYAGGGGVSTLTGLPDYQQRFGLTGTHAHKPDVAALAGFPDFPGGGIGTSGASPLVASGMAVVDSFLLAHGVTPPGFLNPVLYDIAASDAYRTVFSDVTVGSNDLFGLGCCDAAAGYDEASGLGSIRFDELARYLLGPPTTTTTTGSKADVTVTPTFTG